MEMTRVDACVLNRLAQHIAGSGAVEIVYKGIEPESIDRLAEAAVSGERNCVTGRLRHGAAIRRGDGVLAVTE